MYCNFNTSLHSPHLILSSLELLQCISSHPDLGARTASGRFGVGTIPDTCKSVRYILEPAEITLDEEIGSNMLSRIQIYTPIFKHIPQILFTQSLSERTLYLVLGDIVAHTSGLQQEHLEQLRGRYPGKFWTRRSTSWCYLAFSRVAVSLFNKLQLSQSTPI